VSVSGDTALVGVYGDDVGKNADQGSAYVFLRVGGAWTLEAKLTAGDGAANDYFGLSVSVFGDTALVGASLNDVGTKTDQGSAYVFVRSGTTWTQQAKLTAGDGAAFDAFGSSVSVTGDTAVIGAFQDDVSTSTDQGSAYVFVRSGSAWTQQAKLTAGDGAANDAFGSSVSVSGDTALLGAHQDDIGISTNQGSAYVFVRTGTTWTQQAKLTAGDGVTADTFGYSVSVSGDTALVGAYWDNIGANTDQGSAYVFVRSGTSWSEQAKLTASDGAAFDYFGSSVSVSGDTAVVGAYFDDVGANVNQGSAYVFVRSGTAWTQQAKLTAGDGAANDSFGSSVSVSGDTTLAGAYADDLGANTNQGSTSVFVRAGTSWTQLTKLTAGEGSANDNFGFSVSLSGDTALVGVYRDDVGTNVDQGSAYVFVRSGTAWRQQARLTAGDGAAVDLFGLSVSLSGDTALVGAFGDDVGTNNAQGSAYVFVRAGPTWTQQAKLTAGDGAANDNFGFSVSLSGDTALAGAPWDDVGNNTNQGSASVFVRAGTTWTQQAKLTANDGAANDSFGANLAVSGDTALVGAFQDDVGTNTDQGSAYVFVRSGTTWTQQVKLTAGDGAAGDVFGTSVSIAGDTALVGSPGAGGIAPYGNAQEGAAYFGRLLFANGTACTSAGQCGSGFCVDGVCCNTACGGGATNDCRVCSAAAGAASNGTCAPTNGNACFDGLTCTTADVCVSGTCTGGASPCLTGTSCTEGGSGGYSCSACPAGTFSADGTGRSACTPCVSGSWSAAGATSCAPWKSCALGSYVSTAASTSADRVCAACAAGSFSSSPNQSTCLPWSTCASTEFESSAGSPTVDRTCTACRRCAPEDVEVTACTANSDTVCAPVLDAGTPDAGAADAGTADAGVSPSPPPATGCGCVAAGTEPRGHGASLSLIGFGLLVSLRRRARSG
jgi:MYXO-CTERM domain-containing protein